jgi:hypothetical protein
MSLDRIVEMADTPALYGLNRPYALLHLLNSPGPTLARWDRLLADRDVPGVAGTDAHGGFLSYESLFSLMRNYLVLAAPLTGRFDEDRRAVLDALRHGRSYIGIDGLADAGGFSFVAEAPGQRWTMGDTVPLVAGLRLRGGRARTQRGSHFLLIARRVLMTGIPRRAGRRRACAGVYRIGSPSGPGHRAMDSQQPIYIFDSATREAGRAGRLARRDPKRPRHDGPRRLRGQDCLSSLEPIRDRVSSPQVLDPRGGSGRSGAARLEFTSASRPRITPPACSLALVDWTHARFGRPLGARLLGPR